MSLMFLSSGLFVVSCLFVTVEPITDELLPPQNVSIRWVDDFQPGLSWEPPPQHPMPNQCQYNVNSKFPDRFYPDVSSPWNATMIMKGGFLEFSIKTVCNGRESKPVVVNVNYTDLVKNFECYSTTKRQAYCSWSSASPAQDLRFYYKSVGDDECNSPELRECSSYNSTDGVRTSCDLQVTTGCFFNMLFNGTLDNKPVRNTFEMLLTEKVRPPPLVWTVTKNMTHFNLNWVPPDVLNPTSWTFKINYTVCDERKPKEIKGQTSHTLIVTPHCAHRIAIQALSGGGATPWTEEKYFAADKDLNAFVYAVAIVIPLVISSLAVGIFVCWRKNKERIFPKVPAPVDLLSSISDNNNKNTLYVPTEEEESCNISLVIESNTSKQFD